MPSSVPRWIAPTLVALSLLGCGQRGARFRSRQPIRLHAETGQVVTGGRLALQAIRLGQPDPTLRWEVLDGAEGAVLPGGVFLAGPLPGAVRLRVVDPRSGERAETTIQVVPDPGFPGDPASAELYDPALVQGGAVGRMRVGRIGHAACLLKDGRVLVSGGRGRPGGAALRSAELFDPATRTWRPSLGQGEPRAGHSLTLLGDGTVLVLGGGSATAECYDPVKDQFLAAGTCPAAEGPHRTLVLGTGDLLVVGNGASRYSLAQGAFSPVPFEGLPPLAGMSLTELSDGTVLVAGGTSAGGTLPQADLLQLDLRQGSVVRRGALTRGRAWHAAHVMPGMRLLIYGGTPAASDPPGGTDAVEEVNLEDWTVKAGPPLEGTLAGTATVQLQDGRLVALGTLEGSAGQKAVFLLIPVGHQLRPLRDLGMARVGHTLTLLKDGRILVAGGMERSEGPFRSRAGARS